MIFFKTEDQFMIIPTLGFVWNEQECYFVLSWLQYGINILLFKNNI